METHVDESFPEAGGRGSWERLLTTGGISLGGNENIPQLNSVMGTTLRIRTLHFMLQEKGTSWWVNCISIEAKAETVSRTVWLAQCGVGTGTVTEDWGGGGRGAS